MRPPLSSRKVALCGLLFAMAMVLSFAESFIPFPLPGVRPGLSNVVVMFCVFVLGGVYAVLLAVLKAVFVLLTRGLTGALLSLMGGLASVGAMCLLARLRRPVMSVGAVSMAGAICHNVGQLAGAWLLLQNRFVLAYFPIMLAAGAAMGLVTAVIYKSVSLPLERLMGRDRSNFNR